MPKITGNPVATPVPKPDWNQIDPSKADYIKNKPTIPYITNSVQGADITLNDSNTSPLRNLQIFGLSFVDDEPRPDNPTTIYHKEGATITVGDKQVTVPYKLGGVQTNPGKFNNSATTWRDGNFIDVNGKHWWCDEVDFESGVLRKYIKKYEFTGDETWITASSNYTGRMVFYSHSIVRDTKLLANRGFCTHYPNGVNSGYSNVFMINISSNTQMFFNTEFETLADFKAFLTSQYEVGTPLTIYVALQTPEETPLTEEELIAYKTLATTYPTTTISSNNGAGIGVTYCADTKNYIDNKFNELATAIVANS